MSYERGVPMSATDVFCQPFCPASGPDRGAHGARRDHRTRVRRTSACADVRRTSVPGRRIRRRQGKSRRAPRRQALHPAPGLGTRDGGGRIGPPPVHERFRPAERARRPHHLRSDAADAAAGARHELRRRDGAPGRPGPPARPARRPRVDDLPGHDRRARAGNPRGDRAGLRQRLLPGLLAGAGRPGKRELRDGDDPEGRRRRRRDLGRSGAGPLRRASFRRP